MRVTERDRRVVRKIAASSWLTTSQIAGMCFPGLTVEMARRRLRLLRAAQYIRTVRANAMAEAIYTLGTHGRELLGRERAERTRLQRVLPRNLAHLVGINDIRMAVERSAQAHDIKLSFFLASWELQAHGWNFPIIPDAASRVERGGTSVVALFEYDRGEERPSYLLRKFSRYRQGLPGFPFSRVIIVAETVELQERLEAYLGKDLPHPLFSLVAKETLMDSWSVEGLLS
jgi:hypothetical protein